MADLDYKKIEQYNQMFQDWKEEIFPNKEYEKVNEACFAFAHKLSKKAAEKNLLPIKVWCLQSSREETGVSAFVQNQHKDGFEKLEWSGYHVAMAIDLPIYKDSSKLERLVFDPCIFEGVVRESDWQKALDAAPYCVEYSDANKFWRDEAPKNPDEYANRSLKLIRGKPISNLGSPLVKLAQIARKKEQSAFVGQQFKSSPSFARL